MRLGGRLQAAIEVLEDMDKRHRPAADALKDWGVSHRFAGSGDRSAIGNFAYDALRLKRSAAWKLGGEGPRSAVLGALMIRTGMTPDGLVAELEGDSHAPEPLTGAERQAWQSRNLTDAPDAVRADVPDWTAPLLAEAFGAEWVTEAAALAERPPLDLRVNTHLSTREKVLAELADTGASASALAPHGIRIAPIAGHGRHPNVQAEPAFQKGWFEIQDEGSQLAAHLAAPENAAQVLDYCAGGGGKTLALSAAMANKGQIFAHDTEKVRLAPIFERLKRAECRNVQVITPRELAGHEAMMDLVLVDAPCTGSGTWRRRPDAKWRLSERQLAVRCGEQAAILAKASAFVKPGGRLAYVTCSVFAEENHKQIAAFLAANPGFAPVDHQALWAAKVPDGALPNVGAHGLTLSPVRTGTDGFFFSLLERRMGT